MAKSFQVHDANGVAITIGQLDAEAAAFWNKELHPKNYANPVHPKEGEDEDSVNYILKEMRGNWYDIIGYNIANQGHACSGWANVVATMLAENIGMRFIDTSKGYVDRPVKVAFGELLELGDDKYDIKFDKELMLSLYGSMLFYKPYVELINHWHSKGYKPVSLQE